MEPPTPHHAACVSSIAAQLLGSPGREAQPAEHTAQQVAAHWLASDPDARQHLVSACANRVADALVEGCNGVSERELLQAVQHLRPEARPASGPCLPEALPALCPDMHAFVEQACHHHSGMSVRHVLEVCADASAAIARGDPSAACGWGCSVATVLGDAAVALLDERRGGEAAGGSRWLQVVLLSMTACAVHGCYRSVRCDHGPQLVGRLLSAAAAASVEDAAGVVFAVVLSEPLGALGRHMAALRRLWQAPPEPQQGVAVRPMAAVAVVAMDVTATAACQEGRGELLMALGRAVQSRGLRLWGWRPAGTAAVSSLCTALVQMLESAADGGDGGQACWQMCEELEWLEGCMPSHEARCPQQERQGDEQGAASYSSSSSDSSSGSGSGAGSQCHSGDSGESRQAGGESGGGVRAAALSAGVQEVTRAMAVAAECCGWRWAADELLDGVVWPAVQRLHGVRSAEAELVCSGLQGMMGQLLDAVVTMSKNDEVACEYVASTREALQFVS